MESVRAARGVQRHQPAPEPPDARAICRSSLTTAAQQINAGIDILGEATAARSRQAVDVT
jgi:hypothetical protein